MMHRCMGCMAEYSAELSVCPYCNYQKNSKAAQPYCLVPETVLDRKYIVGRVLSEDAFAISYLAWDFEKNMSVVIKEYFPKELSSRMPGQTEVSFYDGEKAKQYESGLMAFVDETNHLVRITQDLDGVAKVFSIFVENSTAYAVSEHLETVSFKDIISMEGRLPWQDAVALMLPLIQSLDTIHNNGLINYGITPDKIVMTRDRKIKLLDFGGSRFETVGSNKNISLITDEGFSAVELYRDDEISPASDVYSVAATLYYAVTGVIPPSAIDRSNNDKIKTPSQLGVEITENAENAIMNALNVNSAYRTQSCFELLNQIFSEDTVERVVEVKKKSDSGRWSKKAKIAVSVIAVVVIAAIAVIFVTLKPQNTEETEFAVIPSFIEMEYDAAVEEMKKLGFSEEQIVNAGTMPVSDKALDGKIAAQDIADGTEINEGDSEQFVINVQIGKYDKNAEELARKKVKMPELVGLSKEEANKKLKKAGFVSHITVEGSEYNDDVKQGLICRQETEAGAEVLAGDEVKCYISKGPKPVETTTKATEENKKDENKATTKAQTTKTQTTKAQTTKAQTTTKVPTTKTQTTTKVPTTKTEATTPNPVVRPSPTQAPTQPPTTATQPPTMKPTQPPSVDAGEFE